MSAYTVSAPAATPRVAAVPAPGGRRHRVLLVVLALLVLLLVWLSLTVGNDMSAGEILAALGGAEEGRFTIMRLRLPRLLLGVAVGVAFALAGALFQTVLRNPLASPDILGISGGASLAAASAILLGGLSGAAVSGVALLGAFAAAAAIYLLAWRSGVSGHRFVLIGVGLAFVIQACLAYLVSRADISDVRVALVWMAGSLGNPAWGDLALLAVTLVVLLVALLGVVGPVRVLQLGDDLAGGLGISPEIIRSAALALAVTFAAVATAAAGPVAFVAFVSAPIARRLVRGGGLALVPAALVGAVLVLAADLVGQHLTGLNLPVGIVTGAVGAPYLLWLLATGGRPARST